MRLSAARWCRRTVALVVLLSSTGVTGCAVHYYDAATGAEHIWGIGHMVMRAPVPAEGHRALVRGTSVLGLAVGKLGGEHYLTLGWERRHRLEMFDESTAIGLAWPGGSFLNVRVGSHLPSFVGTRGPHDPEVGK